MQPLQGLIADIVFRYKNDFPIPEGSCCMKGRNWLITIKREIALSTYSLKGIEPGTGGILVAI